MALLDGGIQVWGFLCIDVCVGVDMVYRMKMQSIPAPF